MPRLYYGAVPGLIVVLLAALMPAMSGCETSEGFGRDLQSLGQNLEDEAEEAD